MTDSEFLPGAARFGNFINYYEFNAPENRLKVLPDDLLANLGFSPSSSVVALDVGCNSGDMTLSLHNVLNSGNENESRVHMLGVDLDPILITRAEEKNSHPDSITFCILDVMSGDSADLISNYLIKHDRKKFDVVFCLSVSMWIHLNYGDEGLKKFLSTMAALTKVLIIEPQPWKCYKTAVRRANRLKQDKFQYFESLQIRQNILDYIGSYLESDCNMALKDCYGKTAWDRPIMVFQKIGM